MDLQRLDLNLLSVLDALVEEKNLGRAAARVGLTQPAMSQALAKLRRLVDDPVLVRVHGKMVPTARAWELHAALGKIWPQLAEALAPAVPFDAKTSRHTFTLGVSDYAEFVVLPTLVQKLAELAPGVRVAVRTLHGEAPWGELESGRVDLVLAEPAELPEGLKRLQLFDERPVAVVRKGHGRALSRPGASARPSGSASMKDKPSALTPAQVEALDFVEVAPRPGNPSILAELRAAGMEAHAALHVPSFLVAPMIVAQTDQAAVLPERVARHFARILPIRVMELPVRLTGRPLCLVWRGGEEPASIGWLRDVVAQVGRKL